MEQFRSYSKSFAVFKNIQKLIRALPSNVFNCDNHKGIKLITRLHVDISHLHEHKFKHSFQDCLNPIYSGDLDIKSTSHFLFHRLTFYDERYPLLSTLNKTDCKLLELTNSSLLQTLLYGTHYFIKKKTHSFLTQQLNKFNSLKDSKSLLISKFLVESLNPSISFLIFFIIFTFYLFSQIFFYTYYFIPRHFRILVPGDCDF